MDASACYPPDNYGGQSVYSADGQPFDPVVGSWPTGKPMLRSEYNAIKYGSIGLFNQLAQVAGSESMAPGSAIVKGESNALIAASRRAGYNPPSKPPRPIEVDYPAGAPVDGTGQLTATIDGSPFTARWVAGRTLAGGQDAPIPPAQYDALSESLIGTRPSPVPAREIGGDAGRIVKSYDPVTGNPERNILFSSGLRPAEQDRVIAHEIGHAIDDAAGQIGTSGLVRDELAPLYNTMVTSQERSTHLTGPQHLKYSGDEVPREFMAEAIRAYMTNPNYLKTVAPKTAERIRDAVNAHPVLSRIIQFNSLGPLAALGLGGVQAYQDGGQ